ncbi:MAG TPA: DUF167 domain-containing protein [Acidimicrobiia bacterium]|nr:DUF167 domain-containing protein [Acidimicrobiia bacterium]
MECWIVPGASRTEIKGIHGERLRIRVAAPPEGGRANREVLDLIGARCGSRAELLSGSTSRHKRILVRVANRSALARALLPDQPI